MAVVAIKVPTGLVSEGQGTGLVDENVTAPNIRAGEVDALTGADRRASFTPLEAFDRAGKEWDFSVETNLPIRGVKNIYSDLKEEGQVENFKDTFNIVVNGRRPVGERKKFAIKDLAIPVSQPRRPGLLERTVKTFGRGFVNILAAFETKSELGETMIDLAVFSERVETATEAGLMPKDGSLKDYLAIDEDVRDELFGGETIFEHRNRIKAKRISEIPGFKATALPESITIPEKAADVVGNVASFITKLAVTKQIIGAPFAGRNILAWETLNQAEGGIPGAGAAMYVTLRGIDKIPIKGAKGFFVKTGSQSAVFAGTTAVAGGDAEAIATAALLPWALRGFDAAAKGIARSARVKLEAKAVKNLREIGEKNGIDLSKVPDSSLKFVISKSRQARFWNQQFDKGKITEETLNNRLNQIRKDVTPILGAIAKQQPVAATGKDIVKAEPSVKPATEPAVRPPAVKPKLPTEAETFETFKGAFADATEAEVVQFMLKDGLRPPKEILEKHKDLPEVQLALTDIDIERVAQIRKEEKAVGFSDPKTTRPGSTTLVNDAAVEAVTIARELGDIAVKATKASSNLLKRNTAKAIDHIGTLGAGGTKLSKDMDDIAFKTTRNANIDLLAIKKAYGGMSHADRVKVSKLMNGYLKESEVSDKVAVARDAILDILDRGMHEANKVGIRRMVSGESLELGGSGKAAPQVLNRKGIAFFKELDKKGMGSQAVLQMAERMIESGQATSIEDAVTKLQQFRDAQLRGINPYFERARIELPEEFIEWDGLNTLPRLLEKNWLTIEGVRKWGWDTSSKSFPKANVAIEVVRKEFGEKEADRIQRFINASFLGKTTASLDSQQLSQAMRDYQFITKIALSPVTIMRNMADRLPKGMTAGGLLANIDALKAYPPLLNNFIEASKRIEKNIIRSGAAFGHTAMAEDFEAGTQVKNIIGLPFSASELGNQVHIALVRKFQMERDINSLIKAQGKDGALYKAFDKMATVVGGSQKQVRNRLRELGNDELVERLAAGAALDGDLLDAVLHRTVRDKTFPILLSTKPIWWDNHPWARAAAQFKTWPVRQTQHIWNDVIKYTVKTGDVSRMVRFLIATAVVGEVYNVTRDFLTDRRESLTSTLIDGKSQKDVAISLLNAFFDGGGIGILADFTYGFTDWLIGPSGATGKNVRDTVSRIYKEPDLAPQAVLKAIRKEVQPVKQSLEIINQVDRQHFNKNNITKQYAKWRAEGYKWARDKRAPTVGEKIKEFGDDFLFGKRQFRPGDDSLALEMAARQVMVGDLDDAADYIKLIIDRASTPEEIAEAYKKIQVSMKSRAPLGKIPERDLGQFLATQSPEDIKEASNVNAVWFKNYADAIQRAVEVPED